MKNALMINWYFFSFVKEIFYCFLIFRTADWKTNLNHVFKGAKEWHYLVNSSALPFLQLITAHKHQNSLLVFDVWCPENHYHCQRVTFRKTKNALNCSLMHFSSLAKIKCSFDLSNCTFAFKDTQRFYSKAYWKITLFKNKKQ